MVYLCSSLFHVQIDNSLRYMRITRVPATYLRTTALYLYRLLGAKQNQLNAHAGRGVSQVGLPPKCLKNSWGRVRQTCPSMQSSYITAVIDDKTRTRYTFDNCTCVCA